MPLRRVQADGAGARRGMPRGPGRAGPSGQTARNVIPDLMELNLNYRFAPGKSLEQAREDVLALVAGRAEVEFTDLSPSGRVCTDNPLVRYLRSSSGLDTRSKQAWTDVARLGSLGVDAINLGPGETGQAHQAGESLLAHRATPVMHARRSARRSPWEDATKSACFRW